MLKIIITEFKDLLEGFNNTLDQAEERISVLEDKSLKIIHLEKQKEKRTKKSEASLRDLWDLDSRSMYTLCQKVDQCIDYGDLRRRREKKAEFIWRNNGWKLSKSWGEMGIHIQEAQKTPTRIAPPKKVNESDYELSKVSNKES